MWESRAEYADGKAVEMTRYNLGNGIRAEVEKTSSGYFAVRIMDADGRIWQDMYSTEVEALRSVLIWAEEDPVIVMREA